MQPPLVLFDLDNTLVDRQGTLAGWVTEFTAQHGMEDEDQAYVLDMGGRAGLSIHV
ncbi:putative hydrolase of the HAD superfamily [Streptomyces sp. DconLS]|uniref:hypothetical protein n=1 Tax=Streptomyces sp. LamerLS-31b TaxID=1839765 RepID=UPI00081E69CB|nr:MULTISPECIES: hypothetical protein [unclassified Streptomyces]SCF97529.1 putative hydrolase of the HAD superfamily [Streptomyces sp. DconLS]SCG02278.1 putative hydrolase of the HAD superfamily [Streptomyces sp. LamerLS-31b]